MRVLQVHRSQSGVLVLLVLKRIFQLPSVDVHLDEQSVQWQIDVDDKVTLPIFSSFEIERFHVTMFYRTATSTLFSTEMYRTEKHTER